jgi:uncharacterized protein YbcI
MGKPAWSDTEMFGHAFFLRGLAHLLPGRRYSMNKADSTMAQQVALAASEFQHQRTGHMPKSVTVVLSGETLVIMLHGALSPAEQALAMSPAGAAQVQEFHRQLFITSADTLRNEIRKITGVKVREAAAEVELATGTMVQVFNTGTMVQVFLLAHGLPEESWNGKAAGDRALNDQGQSLRAVGAEME